MLAPRSREDRTGLLVHCLRDAHISLARVRAVAKALTSALAHFPPDPDAPEEKDDAMQRADAPDLEALIADQEALNSYLEALGDRARGLARRLDELDTLRTAITVLHEALVGERITSIRARTAYARAISEAGGEGPLAVLAPAFGLTGDRATAALETRLRALLDPADPGGAPTPAKPRRRSRPKGV
ncbi:hypothetical protein [Pontivivens ytuae]|uniref:Uncharacterized protein n=1 Tax=Pontivivens ytuae TaxID=2789856 RepID=A0A7S9LRD7_9RHOB|nr:hypothetical protein [Pontivivens ytuae]QPH53340.1 hypothetical protein I0K15_16335 [Pontivivens ytuae]